MLKPLNYFRKEITSMLQKYFRKYVRRKQHIYPRIFYEIDITLTPNLTDIIRRKIMKYFEEIFHKIKQIKSSNI